GWVRVGKAGEGVGRLGRVAADRPVTAPGAADTGDRACTPGVRLCGATNDPRGFASGRLQRLRDVDVIVPFPRGCVEVRFVWIEHPKQKGGSPGFDAVR